MTQLLYRLLLLLGLLWLTLACRPAPSLSIQANQATTPTSPQNPAPPPSTTAWATSTVTPTTALATTFVTETAPPPTATPTEVLPLAGLNKAQQQVLATLPDHGPAPVWENTVWLNSEPLRLADLRGKVVIVEFWTYG